MSAFRLSVLNLIGAFTLCKGLVVQVSKERNYTWGLQCTQRHLKTTGFKGDVTLGYMNSLLPGV